MSLVLYAQFGSVALAQQAAGALLSYGVHPTDVSMVCRNVDTGEGRRDYVAHSVRERVRAPIEPAAKMPGLRVGDTPPAEQGTAPDAKQIAKQKRRDNASGPAREGTEYVNETDESRTLFERLSGHWAERRADTHIRDDNMKGGFGPAEERDITAAPQEQGPPVGESEEALSTTAVPNIGLVGGNGPLTLALAAPDPASAHSLFQCLQESGLPDDAARRYADAYEKDRTVMAISLPSGDVDQLTAKQILRKYGAVNVRAFGRG